MSVTHSTDSKKCYFQTGKGMYFRISGNGLDKKHKMRERKEEREERRSQLVGECRRMGGRDGGSEEG